LKNPSSFLFNLYYENGAYHCTCCLDCIEIRSVPDGRVYETCSATSQVVLKVKLNRKHVNSGSKLQYKLLVKRRQQEKARQQTAISGVGVQAILPSGVAYIQTESMPALRTRTDLGLVGVGEGGKTILTWTNLTFAPKQRYQLLKIHLQVRKPFNASALYPKMYKKGMAMVHLPFAAKLFQMGGVNDILMTCQRSVPNSTAVVKTQQQGWGSSRWGGK
jgi:hypothetical protein